MKITRSTLAALALGTGLTLSTGLLVAQAPALQRTVVAKADVSVPGREAVVARIEIAPGGVAGWHTHPGDEITYLMEGEVEVMIAGQPSKVFKPGEAFVIPAGTVHNARNPGSGPAKLAGTYVVEKGKPLASPAAAPN
jgi:quercetin dioxygenase-like cupin family protein